MTWITVDTPQSDHFSHVVPALRGLATALRSAYRQYREDRLQRAAFFNLLTLDDAILEDIGVTRGEVARAARLPLEINAARALHDKRQPRAVLACLTDK